jgi:hypothetical protein
MVAETSIRPIRSAKTLVGVKTVMMSLIFTDFRAKVKADTRNEAKDSLREDDAMENRLPDQCAHWDDVQHGI